MDEYLQNYMFFKFSGRSSHKPNKEKYPEPLKNTLLKTEQWEFFFYYCLWLQMYLRNLFSYLIFL